MLPELTGASKPMLGQIERGQSFPAINILWKISTGLKIPFSFIRKREMYELVQDHEKCHYVNCPAKIGVCVAGSAILNTYSNTDRIGGSRCL